MYLFAISLFSIIVIRKMKLPITKMFKNAQIHENKLRLKSENKKCLEKGLPMT